MACADEGHYIYNGTKRLRCGYTTGSCATMAAMAATQLMLGHACPPRVRLMTPAGLAVEADVVDPRLETDGSAVCGIVKDGGDDADATDGMLICARVSASSRTEGPVVAIDGGEGIGRVTMPGLDQPVGNAAINSTPRLMISEQLERLASELGFAGRLDVCVFAPEGERVGAHTFNPSMGVVGGISILGTSGIVRPMSEKALIDSIELEVRQKAALGHRDLVLVPGNYGADHAKGLPELEGLSRVSFSNFLGEALDMCANHGFERVVVVGHSGKLVKVAGGIMNTHSRMADCRDEIVCAHAAMAGASTDLARRLMACATTDAAMGLLKEAGLYERVCETLTQAVVDHLERRVAGAYEVGCIMFSKALGELGRGQGTNELIGRMRACEGLEPRTVV